MASDAIKKIEKEVVLLSIVLIAFDGTEMRCINYNNVLFINNVLFVMF